MKHLSCQTALPIGSWARPLSNSIRTLFLVSACAVLVAGCHDEATVECPDCSARDAPVCHRSLCNTDTGDCEPVPLEDGTPCSDPASCSIGDSCIAGACQPGPEIECGEAPLCQQVRCDPEADRCVSEAVADDTPCSTPCLLDGACAAGECAGEMPDCAWLSDACSQGQCHPETGACYLAPAPVGLDCPPRDPRCATGACDGRGTCVEETQDDGTPCDDGDPCTDDDQCRDGLCSGGAVTECRTGDGCCPSGCADDADCCEVAGPVEDPGSWAFEHDGLLLAEEGQVLLTPALGYRLGQVWLDHDVTQPFEATFRFRAARSEDAADGMVFMFYKSRDYEPARGGSLGFNGGGDCVVSEGDTGYGVEIDHYQNGCDPGANHFGIIYGSSGNHLDVAPDARTWDSEWHEVVVVVDTESISVIVDGVSTAHWEGEIDRSHGGLGFSAATGGLNEEYLVADVVITCLR